MFQIPVFSQFNHKLCPLSPTNILCLKDSLNNIWNQGDFENPDFPALYRSTKNSEKMFFPLGNEEFKPTGNFAHSTEFFTIRKFDLLIFYPSRQLRKWKLFGYVFTFNNDFMINKKLNYVRFNVFSVIRNDFELLFNYWWVTLHVWVSSWGRVVEKNFNLIDFGSCWKLFLSLSTESHKMKMHCS